MRDYLSIHPTVATSASPFDRFVCGSRRLTPTLYRLREGNMNVNQLVDVGETKLYCEVHGSGPSLVLVPGASGDGGYMQPLADALANEFTVITYERRGNSRSPRPEGWTKTSIETYKRRTSP
jgi:pimeloyl-ACP methyl ester carboxylesterase